MLQAIQRCNAIKHLVRIRQRPAQISALDVYPIEPKKFRIEIAATHVKSLGHQILC